MDPVRKWGITWISLALAIALHVADEALTGFLPFYNSMVRSLQESYSWIPLPTFSFTVWIIGVLMVANAIDHIGASLYWGKLVPGVYSSPILLVAALALLNTTYTTRRGQEQVSSGTR